MRLCTADWLQESLLVVSGSKVLRMSTDHVGGLPDDVIYSTVAGSEVTAVSYDPVSGKLYVAVSSDSDDGGYIASDGLDQQPVSR